MAAPTPASPPSTRGVAAAGWVGPLGLAKCCRACLAGAPPPPPPPPGVHCSPDPAPTFHPTLVPVLTTAGAGQQGVEARLRHAAAPEGSAGEGGGAWGECEGRLAAERRQAVGGSGGGQEQGEASVLLPFTLPSRASTPSLPQVRSVAPAADEASVLRPDDILMKIDGVRGRELVGLLLLLPTAWRPPPRSPVGHDQALAPRATSVLTPCSPPPALLPPVLSTDRGGQRRHGALPPRRACGLQVRSQLPACMHALPAHLHALSLPACLCLPACLHGCLSACVDA